MVLRSKTTTKRKLKTLQLYADQISDRQYSQKWRVYLQPHESELMHSANAYAINNKNEIDIRNQIRQSDVLFLLGSMALHNALLKHRTIAHAIEQEIKTKRLKVICVHIEPFPCRINWLKAIPNQLGDSFLLDAKWPHYAAAFTAVDEKISVQVQKAYQQKNELLSEWRHTKQLNTRKSYADFLQKHKHSRFAAKAKQRWERIEENRLWAIAQKADSLKGYFLYIQYAPLSEHLAEAGRKLGEIEQQEAVYEHDASKFAEVAFGFSFKNQFTQSQNQKIEDLIDPYWKATVTEAPQGLADITGEGTSRQGLGKRTARQLKGNFLDFQSTIMLEAEEQFRYGQIFSFYRQFLQKLEVQKRRRVDEYGLTQILLLIGSLSLFGVMIYWNAPKWSFLAVFVLLVNFVWPMMQKMQQEKRFFALANRYLKENLTLAKVFFLLHRDKEYMQRMSVIRKIESDLHAILQKQKQKLDLTYLEKALPTEKNA